MNLAAWCRRQRNLLDAQLKLVPRDWDRMHALAQAELTLGNLGRGFELFEARLVDRTSGTGWMTAQPRWYGEPAIDGFDGTLYVQPEQGLGDVIMMARYLPLCRDRWTQVRVEVRPPLYRLLQQQYGAMIVPLGEEAPDYDFAIPMLSLPLAFRTSDENSIPSMTWAVPPDPRFAGKIGLCWRGAAHHKDDASRSIPRGLMQLLVRQTADMDPRPQYVSLQWEELHLEGTESVAGLALDVADTARIVAGLGGVITCDTMLAHLAGALHVPCWVLLPYVPDWRWQLGRTTSPWYPSVRLFRQPRPGDWASVFAKVERQMGRHLELIR